MRPMLFARWYHGVAFPGSVEAEYATLAESPCEAVNVTIAERTLLGLDAAATVRTARAASFGLVALSEEQALVSRTQALTVTSRRTRQWGKRWCDAETGAWVSQV